jgi:hypothetical protein
MADPIDLRLDGDVRRCLDLKIPPSLVLVELAGESAFNLARARVVPFDEIAVVGVHNAHELREARSRTRMKCRSECCGFRGQFRDHVGDRAGNGIQAGRLDPIGAFERHFGRFGIIH